MIFSLFQKTFYKFLYVILSETCWKFSNSFNVLECLVAGKICSLRDMNKPGTNINISISMIYLYWIKQKERQDKLI